MKIPEKNMITNKLIIIYNRFIINDFFIEKTNLFNNCYIFNLKVYVGTIKQTASGSIETIKLPEPIISPSA